MNTSQTTLAALAADLAIVATAAAHLRWAGVGHNLPGVRLATAIVAAAEAKKTAEVAACLALVREGERLRALQAATKRPNTMGRSARRRERKLAAAETGQEQAAA